MNVLVSIITPCYNAEKTISETIKSVLNQTFNDWEMIIIDDSSTDTSASIIKSYCKLDSRIRYFKTESPSGTPAIPRNIGIENALGKYIAFLDADDIWLPDKLENQVKFMANKNCNLSYSYYEKMDWEGHRNNRIIRTRQQATYYSLLKSNSIPFLTSMISKTAVGDTRFKQIAQEDYCFWLDILKKGYTAYNTCEITALYRETKASRSANKFDMFIGHWNVIKKHQKISFIPSCFYMITYSITGMLKYLK